MKAKDSAVLLMLIGMTGTMHAAYRHGGGSFSWGSASNWKDAGGGVSSIVPKTADDDVALDEDATKFHLVTLTPRATFTNFELNSITGKSYQIRFYNDSHRAAPAQKLTIAYPDAFTGFWTSFDKWGLGAIVLPATAEHSPKLSHLRVNAGFGLTVPTAGTSASVESVFGEGALDTSGAGTLTIKKGAGGESRLSVTEGTVELVGRAAADDAGTPVPGAALHLDATAAGTVDTTADVQADGYRHVVAWRDADGGPITAWPDDYMGTDEKFIPWCNRPYLSDDAVSPSGLRMIDFGGSVGSTLPTNCLLKFSQEITHVCEIFWVGRNGGGAPSYFGSDKPSSYFFMGGFTVGSMSQLLDKDAQGRAHFADVRVNNERVPDLAVWSTRHGSDLKSPFVASLSVADDFHDASARFNLLGSMWHAAARTGNLWIGEVLVYTNHLSSSQRTRINDYLMKKWLKGHESEDFGVVYVGRTGDASLAVPEGSVARVAALTVRPGSTFVKKGEGTLSVGTFMSDGATVQVAGGAIKVRAPESVVPQVAGNAYLHLDADKNVMSDYVTDAPGIDPTVKRVLRWNDCSGGAHYASVPEREYWDQFVKPDGVTQWYPTNFPTVVENAANGHAALDFGAYPGAFMWLDEHGPINVSKTDEYARIYEGFAVLRSKSGKGFNFFGSSQCDFLRDGAVRKMLSEGSSHPSARAALWTFDGVARDPIAEDDAFADTTSFHVVSFASAVPMTADLIAKDRLFFINGMGDWQIGEYILYDRRLTPVERRATTAFLMRKWLDKDLPSSTTAPVAYAADADVVVDADVDQVLSGLSGGNGTLVKRGIGDVTIARTGSLTALAAVTVAGGALTLDLTAERRDELADVLDAATFDFDAADYTSFSNEVEVVEGVARTNVIRWVDVNARAGQVAYTAQLANDTTLIPVDGRPADSRIPTMEHPTYRNRTMPDGVDRPTVDFGAFGTTKDNAGAGMHMRTIQDTIREVHTIFADTTADRRGMIVSSRKNGTDGIGSAYQRGANGALLSGSSAASAFVANGYIAVDGVAATASTVLESGFHLVSYAPTKDTWVGTLGLDRTSSCGGCAISEQIAFSRALTSDERTLLQKHLMRKWLGTARETVKAFDSLAVAAGSTLSLGDDVAVSAGTLSGGGTIKVAELRGVSRLEISGAVDTLTVRGTVTFADGPVTVAFADDLRRLAHGDYPVFGADAMPSLMTTEFVLDETHLNSRRVNKIIRQGGQLVLRIERRGLIMVLR